MTNTNKTDLYDYIERNERNIIGFLSNYLQFPSIKVTDTTPGMEKEAQGWLRKQFEEFGFSEIDYWAADVSPDRPNVVGTYKGSGSGRSLIFHGHTDVVPVTEKERPKWNYDPFGGVVDEGYVYGRGANDAKGGNTAMIWAIKALIDCGVKLKGNLSMAAVSGGEGGATLDVVEGTGFEVGSRALLKRGHKADFAVVSEPTDNEICCETGGIFYFELEIPGKEAHTSTRNQVIFPQRYGLPRGEEVGVDALSKSVPFIEMFYRMERNWNFRWQGKMLGGGGYPMSNDKKGLGPFTLNPSFIQGGTYFGTVPPFVKLTYAVWYPNWVKTEDVWDEIKQNVSAIASTDDWLRKNPPTTNIPILRDWRGQSIPVDHEGVQKFGSAYEEATGNKPVYTGFRAVSAATCFQEYDIPAITIGPGDIRTAHAPNERVPVREVIDLTKALAGFAIDFCQE